MVGQKAARSRVVLCGDNCMNVILQLPDVLKRGGNIDLAGTVRRPGGNALVTSLALAGWGIPAAYVGVVGADEAGKELLDWMRGAGVDSGGVVERGETRTSYAIVDQNERTILDERARAGALGPEDWRAYPTIGKSIHEAEVILVDRYSAGIHDLVTSDVVKRRDAGEKPLLVYRTGSRKSQGGSIERRILPAADICMTKRAYLDSLGYEELPEKGCQRLSREFGVPVVVATLGEDGAAYYDAETGEGGTAAARRIERPATTLGGGDWFRAGFILAHLSGKALAESVRWGNAAAALHCSRPESGDPRSLLFPIEEMERAVGVEL